MKKKLYVGNLSFETTESDLKELFGQAGTVETVRIVTDRDTGRSKGFGFVEMQDGCDKAIAEMNGKDFNVFPGFPRRRFQAPLTRLFSLLQGDQPWAVLSLSRLGEPQDRCGYAGRHLRQAFCSERTAN